jgi:hypothetical protein
MTDSITAEEYNRRYGGQKPNKYHARRVVIDGIPFDSTAEGNRYQELKHLESLGLIVNLELQPAFPLTVNDVKIGTYKADFRYVDVETNEVIVEDVKSPMTAKLPMYRWKKKHIKAQYGIDIRESTR